MLENLQAAHLAISKFMQAKTDADLPIVLAYVDPIQPALVIGIDAQAALPPQQYRQRLRHFVESLPLRLQGVSLSRHSSAGPKQQLFDPIIGGIQMVCNFTVEGYSPSTIAVVGSLGGTLGFIVSGHGVGKTNKAVYQPSSGSSNRIGTVKLVSNWQGGTCDAAWVQYKNATRQIPPKGLIYKNGAPYKVTGTKDSTHSNLKDQVTMQGSASAGKSDGRIEALQATVKFASGSFESQTLSNQVLTNYKSIAGDSGAPVFEDAGGDNVTFLGVNVGEAAASDVVSVGQGPVSHLSEYGIYSPWESIVRELGAIDVVAS